MKTIIMLFITIMLLLIYLVTKDDNPFDPPKDQFI